MPCYSPLTAYYGKDRGRTGKRGITFQRSRSLSGLPLKLPCGQCIGCRLERARQWAVRCMHEKRMWKVNCFVTLTYGNNDLPVGGTLVKRDLQLFMKRLRKAHGEDIRFYACGEYGELNQRPHYHVLLFNFDFADKVEIGCNRRGDKYYASGELSELWKLGHSLLGEVTFDSAAYVARYIMKKVTGERADEHYSVYDSDGVVHDRLPEFTVMSRRPGIGSSYYESYGDEVRNNDDVVMGGRRVRVPRFYDNRTERVDPECLVELKQKRKRAAVLVRADNTVERLRVREQVALLKLEQKERSL